MVSNTRDIRRRIRSIQNTKKITRAMELVAASKMRRATQATLATRPYARAAFGVLVNVSSVTEAELHPLLKKREGKRTCLIVFTSDRGLVGGLNTNVVRQALEVIREQGSEQVDVIAVGKKGADALRRSGAKLIAVFTKFTDRPSLRDLRPVLTIAVDDYQAGKYDRVVMIYADFISTLLQRPRVRQLLPFSRESLEQILEQTGVGRAEPPKLEYLFEPSAEEVLSTMLTGLLAMQVYQALLEATASEHSARMVAMRNATDAASDFIDDLTLEFNQVRQASITKDLAEISAGRSALEG